MMCKPTHWEGSRLLQFHCSGIALYRLVLCYTYWYCCIVAKWFNYWEVCSLHLIQLHWGDDVQTNPVGGFAPLTIPLQWYCAFQIGIGIVVSEWVSERSARCIWYNYIEEMMCKPTQREGSRLLQYYCSGFVLHKLVLYYTIHILVLFHIYWYCARIAILWQNGKITDTVARCIWHNYTEEMMCKPTDWDGAILYKEVVLCNAYYYFVLFATLQYCGAKVHPQSHSGHLILTFCLITASGRIPSCSASSSPSLAATELSQPFF